MLKVLYPDIVYPTESNKTGPFKWMFEEDTQVSSEKISISKSFR